MKEDLCLGFSLAGITVFPCAGQRDFRDLLRNAVDSREFAIIITEEELLEGLDFNLRKSLLRQTRPLIVPVQGRLVWKDAEEVSEDELIHRLIRQAVGYQLNIHF